MPNVTLTHQMVAQETAMVFAEEAPFCMNINRGRQEEFGEQGQHNGFKIGDQVKIGIPPVTRVFNGAIFAEGGAATDSIWQNVVLKVDTQKHIPLAFGAKEQALDIAEFRETQIRPAMATLSAVIESDLLAKAYLTVPNVVGTPGTIPTTMKTYAQARAKLNNFLTPPSQRCTIFSSESNTELVDSSKTLFHYDKAIEMGYLEGRIGDAQGATFYEHQSLPVHTNGTQNMSVMLVNGVPAEGATTLAIDTGTTTNTITAGTAFTIAGVFAVHPLTGVAYNFLQQFRCDALTLAAGAGTLTGVFPPFKAVMPNKTVSALPADNAAITMVGAASAAHRQNLMYHKDAFTAAFVPLKVLAGTVGYTARMPNGISVRVMTFGDGKNDLENTRIDLLYAFQAVRGLQAVRITE